MDRLRLFNPGEPLAAGRIFQYAQHQTILHVRLRTRAHQRLASAILFFHVIHMWGYWTGLCGLMMNPQIIMLPSLITFGVSVASGTDAFTCLVMLRARSLGLIFAARLAAIWRPINVPPGKVLPALAWTA